MDSSLVLPYAKRQKHCERQNVGEALDRISNLTESILLHILSFLPTKYAVQTSVLSTRWRYLWTSIPVLHFGDKLFSFEAKRFMDFVDRVLILRDISNIQKFRLKCGHLCDLSRVNAWICAAVRHKVQILNLHIRLRLSIELPRLLFTCKSLVILKLRGCGVVNVPANCIRFPSLKTLHLKSVIFSSYASTEQLFSSCPVLEDLIIESCQWKCSGILNISLLTLKRLTIFEKKMPWKGAGICNIKVMVNAPSLVSLRYNTYLAKDISLQNLTSIVDASIDVILHLSEYDDGHSHHCVARLLTGVSNVKALSLRIDIMEILSLAADYFKHLPTFHNLSHLELKPAEYPLLIKTTCLIHKLLECSPNLESLVCEGELDFKLEEYVQGWGSVSVPQCLLSHLKAVIIKRFEGNMKELEFVEFLLKNAEVLETMTFVSSKRLLADSKKKMEVKRKLQMLPRGSKRCVIVF